MAHLVHDDVVEHLERREDEAPVERQRPRGGTRSPARALVPNLDPPELDAERRRLLLGEHRHELPSRAPRLELGDAAAVEREPRPLPRALGGDPVAVRVEHAVDLAVRHPDGDGQPRGLSPRQVDGPALRAPRAAHHHELVQDRQRTTRVRHRTWCLTREAFATGACESRRPRRRSRRRQSGRAGFLRVRRNYTSQTLCLRITTQALWPPNPNELLIATSISALRASFGT